MHHFQPIVIVIQNGISGNLSMPHFFKRQIRKHFTQFEIRRFHRQQEIFVTITNGQAATTYAQLAATTDKDMAYLVVNIFLANEFIRMENRGGLGCLNSFSASISGASAAVRLPSGVA